jgi:hypothetical protein
MRHAPALGAIALNPTLAIERNSVFVFLLIPPLALWGFWFTYVVRPAETLVGLDHVHGAAMLAWCLMLIAQAGLIRARRRELHAQLGRVSYVLMPLIFVSTLSLAHFRLGVRGLTDEGIYSLVLQLLLTVELVVIYIAAIFLRKRRDLHARLMVCTALPLLDPILARVLAVNVVPGLPFETGIYQYATFALTDLILLTLVIWDWRVQRRRDLFLPVLGFMLSTQAPLFFVIGSPTWTRFASAYLSLPLS